MDHYTADSPPPPERNDGVYELFILVLTVFSLLMLAAYFFLPLADATKETLLWIDIPISMIFLADSFRSLRLAPDKRAFLKWGWLDFLGSIPLILPLRIARVGRLLRAGRTLSHRRASDVGKDLDRDRARGAALLMVLLTIMVLTGATVAVLEFESEAVGANIETGQEAMWWALVTMATVGYGEYVPVTGGGRFAAIALMTVGVGIFGVLASYLARLFLPKRDADDGNLDLNEIKAGLDAVNARLDGMNARLDTIEANLGDLVPPRSDGSEAETD